MTLMRGARVKEEIFEPALDPAIQEEANRDPHTAYAFGRAAPPGYSRITAPLFDNDRVWKLLEGAIDIHIHRFSLTLTSVSILFPERGAA